ncbi:MAG: LysM peptidoglycan-binding domain-containing protein [Planctomycetota bacterium]
MQTLKTGAIIILLMTVVFSAYSSLTTPPDELASEIDGMVIFDDEGQAFDLDTGLPPNFAEMEFDTGQKFDPSTAMAGHPPALASNPNTANNPNAAGDPPPLGNSDFASLGSPSAGNNLSASNNPNGGNSAFNAPGIDVTFSDSASGTAATTASSRVGVESMGDTVAGTGDTTNGEIAIPDSYPQTKRSFALPNPSDAIARLQAAGNFRAEGTATAATPNPSGTLQAVGTLQPGGDLESRRRNMGFENAIRRADEQVEQERYRDALATLSLFYRTPDLTSQQYEQLTSRLDWLIGKVIYSPQHLLDAPYRVQGRETLMQIADQYQVSWQLLANINNIKDPYAMLPGTELKVMKGPFRAEVDLSDKEVTLFLGEYYAGRFQVELGTQPTPVAGQYTVQAKQTGRTYYPAEGAPIAADDANNPYGGVWIDLGGQMSLHGSDSRARPTRAGCISLAGAPAKDLYAILSQGSSVTIRP